MSTTAPYSLPPSKYNNNQPVTVEANIQKALTATEGMSAPEKYLWFKEQVQKGGPMDYKNTDNYLEYSNSPASQDFGNFNYGAVGNALGMPQNILDAMAGWQQVKTDITSLLDGDPGTNPNGSMLPFDKNYGDSPGDQDKINEGIKWSQDNGFTPATELPEQDGLDFLRKLLDFFFTPAYGADINPLTTTQFTSATLATPPKVDPLVLDLDNDGLETTGLNATNPIFFDMDGNPNTPKTATGWVSADDAFLVLDKNANGSIDSGRELFGDSTLKSNGQLATDGFDALRDLDANADGKVDAGDAQFANLRLWRDLNQDGISQANELFTLGSQNIAAINAGSTEHSQILANGNQLADLGSYVKTDGSVVVAASAALQPRPTPCGCSVATLGEVTGNLGDINLVQDTFHSRFTDTLDTSAVATLPDMQGAGQVRSLREAASLSTTLAQLLTDFAAASTRAAQQALIDTILKAWSDTSIMSTTFNGAYAGHALTVNGLTFNTVPAGTAANDKTWRMAA